MGSESAEVTLAELMRIIDLRRSAPGQLLVGLVGPPGAGKSTMAQGIADELGPGSVVVGMDGFHLGSRVLALQGLTDVKGAPETFDADGLVHLLERIRHRRGPDVIYAPVFDRAIEEPIAAGVAITGHHDIVIVEGNYLLLDGPWAPVRPLLDLTAYIDLDSTQRRTRLVARHMAHGRGADDAQAWVDRSDAANATLIETTRDRADYRVPGA